MIPRKVSCLVALASALLAGNVAISAGKSPEKWADPALKVSHGMILWLDAGRQDVARAARSKPPLRSGGPIDVWYDASGHGLHLVQQFQASQPRFLAAGSKAAVR